MNIRSLLKGKMPINRKTYLNIRMKTLGQSRKQLAKRIAQAEQEAAELRKKVSRFEERFNVKMSAIERSIENVTPAEKYNEMLKCWYVNKMEKGIDIDNPKTVNEKTQWLKLYDSNENKTRLADKVLAREYFREKYGEEYLVPIVGVWDSFEKIDFEELPKQFALKVNNGSARNIIVKDKTSVDCFEMEKLVGVWMSTNFAFQNGYELHYANIEPKIIVEKYIQLDYEYQFWCFNGKPDFVAVIDRLHGEDNRASYDMDWNRLEFVSKLPIMNEEIEKPPFFDVMKEIADSECKNFALVRIDFMGSGDKFFFSEFTFTPASGISRWHPEEYDAILGNKIKLPLV